VAAAATAAAEQPQTNRGLFPALMQSFSAQPQAEPNSATAAVASAAPPAPVQAAPITRSLTPIAASSRSIRPITAPEPAAPVVRASLGDPEPERPIIRAAFSPQPTTFNPATRAYGYTPPSRDEDFVPADPAPRADSRFFVHQTVRLSAYPGQRYYAAYSNTVISCFPQRLRQALNTIAEHYGHEVEVTSGHRTNGRRGSYHRKCMAADIRVPGVGPAELARFAKTIEGVNGVGTYRHNNVTHVDSRDYQMSWRY
jgi:hypothetical protein